MRTLFQSASSSSAMINGSEVIDPWPISVAADMMVIVPSGAMLTHGLSICPVRSFTISAASARPPSAMAKERPAAPIITWRRETTASNLLICPFMSRLPRRALDRAHDALIGAATAEIGAHVFHNLVARRFRIVLEQIGCTHDLAGLAVAALRDALGKPGLLHWVTGIRRQALDGRHRPARDLRNLRLA